MKNSNSNFYINIPKKEEYNGIDIGELTVKDNDNRALETHFYNDVLLTNENKICILSLTVEIKRKFHIIF